VIGRLPEWYLDHIHKNLDKHPYLRHLQRSLVVRDRIKDADIKRSTFLLEKEVDLLSRGGGFFSLLGTRYYVKPLRLGKDQCKQIYNSEHFNFYIIIGVMPRASAR
jgi:hypothetical protein